MVPQFSGWIVFPLLLILCSGHQMCPLYKSPMISLFCLFSSSQIFVKVEIHNHPKIQHCLYLVINRIVKKSEDLTHVGDESVKISVVWFLGNFVYCSLCLCHLFCSWSSALFILNVHVSHFCSEQKTWKHDKLQVQCLFIIIKQ